MIHFVAPGGAEVTGAQRCMFVVTTEHYCGAPATVHMWLMDDCHTMSCVDHQSLVESHKHMDEHPISPACGLPNTVWRWSVGADAGWCEVDGFNLSELARIEAPDLTRELVVAPGGGSR